MKGYSISIVSNEFEYVNQHETFLGSFFNFLGKIHLRNILGSCEYQRFTKYSKKNLFSDSGVLPWPVFAFKEKIHTEVRIFVVGQISLSINGKQN